MHGSVLLFVGIIAAIVLISSLLVSTFGTSSFKGKVGELGVRHLSLSGLESQTYHKFHNILLATPDGTTQIDHLLISRFGIFVIETKNWRGWIFGKETDAHWTQMIGEKKFRHVNPMRQNFKHVSAVSATLEISKDRINPVIALVGDSSFKTATPPGVVSGGGLAQYIRSFKNPVFSEPEVLRLVARMQARRLPVTRDSNREHINNLKKRSDPEAHWSCPRCGKSMALRRVRNGPQAGQQFWGCSGYPECRYTRNLPK